MLVSLCQAEAVRASACCCLEGSIVAFARLGAQGRSGFGLLPEAFGTEVVSLTPDRSVLAVEARERWGKSRHTADLNVADCCSYELATQSSATTSRTDLQPAPWPAVARDQGS